MSPDYCYLGKQFNWWADTRLGVDKLAGPGPLRRLITDRGSLTSALIKLGEGNFHVNVLRQTIALPHFHENIKLGRPLARAAMIREVELSIKGTPVVFARSIVPLELAKHGRDGLADLGGKPLGHLLFKDGNIRVSKREFSKIRNGGKDILARRTPYDYLGSRILVAEFFLHSLPEFIS